MIKITSSSNQKYKYFKSLQQKKARCENNEFTVEGIKSVRDAINSGREINAIIVSDKFNDAFDYGKCAVYEVSEPLFNKLCDTKTPQGIMAVIKMYDNSGFIPKLGGAYVYCDNVSDPGNIGTIIRTADAAGLSGVIISKGSVDIYSPKVVRSSMGSFFNIPIITDKDIGDLVKYKSDGFSLIGGALTKETIDFKECDYKKPVIIIVGNEANGISDEVLGNCIPVKIPIFGSAESLNVSVAAGILMYEWARHNRG